MDTRPTFSIVIPCFNYGRFLRAAIDSAIEQGRLDDEILVVDDASTDDTQEIARGYGDQIRYIRNERNLGAGGAWRRGLELAAGEFVVKLDADDALLPGHHDTIERAFRDHPSVAMVMSSVELFRETSQFKEVEYLTESDRLLNAKEFRKRLTEDFFFRMPGCALRKVFLNGHEGPDPDLYQIHDWEYFLRVCKGHEAFLIHRPLAVYRIHDSSISSISRSEHRLFQDVDHWIEVASSPGERQLTRQDLKTIKGSLAIQLITGFGSQSAPGTLSRFMRAYFKALRVGVSGGSISFLRFHWALLKKVSKYASRLWSQK